MGFTKNSLGPFSIRDSRGLILHLNSPLITPFNYDEETAALLDVINKLKQIDEYIQNVKEGTAQSLSTFSEHLLLTTLELNIPLRAFLLEALDTKDTMEIKNLLYPLFYELNQISKLPTGLFDQLVKEAATQQTVDLFKDEDMTIVEEAKRPKIDKDTLEIWPKEHEQKHGVIIRTPQRRYYPKNEIFQKAILLLEKGTSIKESAEILGVKAATL